MVNSVFNFFVEFYVSNLKNKRWKFDHGSFLATNVTEKKQSLTDHV